MGGSASAPVRPPADEPHPDLERTLTHTAVNVMTSQLRQIRNERAHFKGQLEDAMEDLELAQQLMEQQRKDYLFYGAASAVATFCLGGLVAGAVVARQNRSALALLSSEMVDLRRRGAFELAKAERFGSAKLARSLIPSLDAMDAACEHATPTEAEGTRLTRSTLHAALHEHGVEIVKPEMGEAFDPDVHEAMFMVPVDDAAAAGTIQSIFRPGYSLHGERLLRAAQVGVGAKSDETAAAPPPGSAGDAAA